MGNAISNDEYSETTQILDEIFNGDYPILDIGTRAGQTGYIDFIKPSELMNHSIMKGIDYGNRRFLVFKSETEVNGINVQMFTTFFQRYSNNPTLYHTAGNYTKYLFDTVSGCNLIKLKYLRDLLKNRELNLNYEGAVKFNITYRSLYKYTDEEKSAVNDTIRIGWSPCGSIHIGSTVDGEISIIENNDCFSPPQPPTDEEGEYLFKEKSIYSNPGDCIDSDVDDDSEIVEN